MGPGRHYFRQKRLQNAAWPTFQHLYSIRPFCFTAHRTLASDGWFVCGLMSPIHCCFNQSPASRTTGADGVMVLISTESFPLGELRPQMILREWATWIHVPMFRCLVRFQSISAATYCKLTVYQSSAPPAMRWSNRSKCKGAMSCNCFPCCVCVDGWARRHKSMMSIFHPCAQEVWHRIIEMSN